MADVKTIIVDSSSAMRNILRRIVESHGLFTVVGASMNGDFASSQIRSRKPDLVLLGHVESSKSIGQLVNTFVQIDSAMKILLVGDPVILQDPDIKKLLAKNVIGLLIQKSNSSFQVNTESLQRQFKSMSGTILRSRPFRFSSDDKGKSSSNKAFTKPIGQTLRKFNLLPSTRFRLLVVGVSTGGPKALETIFKNFPSKIPLPMVIIQHMPERFTAKLAESLNKLCKPLVIESNEGMSLTANTIYVAKGGKHLVLREREGELVFGEDMSPPVQSCRPSIDVFYKSVSEILPTQNILSFILTGMGRDGADGLLYLKANKCFSITQTRESCVVYGMPKAAYDLGLSDQQMDLDQITDFLKGLR